MPKCGLGHCDGIGSANKDARRKGRLMLRCEDLIETTLKLGEKVIPGRYFREEILVEARYLRIENGVKGYGHFYEVELFGLNGVKHVIQSGNMSSTFNDANSPCDPSVNPNPCRVEACFDGVFGPIDSDSGVKSYCHTDDTQRWWM